MKPGDPSSLGGSGVAAICARICALCEQGWLILVKLRLRNAEADVSAQEESEETVNN